MKPLRPPFAAEVARSFLDTPGLYLHVPLCPSLCPFCPYCRVRQTPALEERFFAALRQEIALYRAALPGPFPSLYVGGGTPSMCLDGLAPIVGELDVAGERAIEVHPMHATTANAVRLRSMGFGHASLGVQSFDERVLRRLQRPTTALANRQALAAFAGRFECLDVDLIFDTAYLGADVLLADVETAIEGGADQVSTYPLMRFGYTPFGSGRHDRVREHALLREVAALAASHGWTRRSVWTFGRPDGPRYSSITREFYLGLGAGASSFTGRQLFVNHFSVERYASKLERGELPVARTLQLRRAGAAAYWLFWRAYAGRIDPGRFEQLFGNSLAGRGALRLAAAMGWMQREPATLAARRTAFRLTPQGQDHYHDVEQWVTYQFIQPLWGEMMLELDSPGSDGVARRRPAPRGAVGVLLAGAGIERETTLA